MLADPRLAAACERLGRDTVKAAIAAAQERARQDEIPADSVAEAAFACLPDHASGLHPVINATGVLLHTNLGRAPLSQAAADAMVAAGGCADVELDLATGRRGRRGASALAALANAVPAAGDVHLVNNNAAALVLAATALASDREIVISRGEMVEIGDGFRIPDLITSTGARLREVGTTNRTTMRDYAAAVGPQTGFILKVHPSNFRIEGFTAVPTVRELAALEAPLAVDIGSGLLRADPALPEEPDATSVLAHGADLVTASGDKLLGGPQAGLVLGDADLVRTLRRHPLARALRVDKITLAAFEATLRGPATPTTAALHTGVDAVRERVEQLVKTLAGDGIDVTGTGSEATVGGGGAPGVSLASAAVSLPESYAAALRTGKPPVLGRLDGGRLLLDLRAVPEDADAAVLTAVRAARTQAEKGGS